MYNAIIDSPTSIKEIIPALYWGTKVNPRLYNVSCTENVYVKIKDEDIIFGVELPNLDVGTVSNREGPICPTAREVLKFMGIGTSKEFAAAAASITRQESSTLHCFTCAAKCMLLNSKCHNGSKKSGSCICVPKWQRYCSLCISRKYILIFCLRKFYCILSYKISWHLFCTYLCFIILPVDK